MSVHCNCFLNKKIFLLNLSALIKTFHSQFCKYGGKPTSIRLITCVENKLYSKSYTNSSDPKFI